MPARAGHAPGNQPPVPQPDQHSQLPVTGRWPAQYGVGELLETLGPGDEGAPGLVSAAVGLEVFSCIEGFYNPRRRHSRLDNLSPDTYEKIHYESLTDFEGARLLGVT
ncbi:hypothetical protein GCM10010123_09560 [Pilimelia anulata]|uniref:Integrase catalytic domain-containing protein n=1 Tax=Pilimelia anulata TaxID=53371 RepID=A0A8J3B1C1_9ACTN|nr:hypothetical protein GCM10010123_09560 [Pilimelia anulata]